MILLSNDFCNTVSEHTAWSGPISTSADMFWRVLQVSPQKKYITSSQIEQVIPLGNLCTPFILFSYEMNSITAIYLKGWLRHWISHESWYAFKQRNQMQPSQTELQSHESFVRLWLMIEFNGISNVILHTVMLFKTFLSNRNSHLVVWLYSYQIQIIHSQLYVLKINKIRDSVEDRQSMIAW